MYIFIFFASLLNVFCSICTWNCFVPIQISRWHFQYRVICFKEILTDNRMAYWKKRVKKKSFTSSSLKSVRLSSELLILTSLPLLFLRKPYKTDCTKKFTGAKLKGIHKTSNTRFNISVFVRFSIRRAIWWNNSDCQRCSYYSISNKASTSATNFISLINYIHSVLLTDLLLPSPFVSHLRTNKHCEHKWKL